MRIADFSLKAQVARVLLAVMIASAQAQQNAPTAAAASTAGSAQPNTPAAAQNVRQPTSSERRKAAKLYLAASKLYEHQQFGQALQQYELAAHLDATNPDYTLAAQVARSHAVTAFIQAAARARTRGDRVAERASLEQALKLDAENPTVAEHLRNLADEAAGPSSMLSEGAEPRLAPPDQLRPSTSRHSFHLRSSQRQLIQQVFKAYGIDATIDDSVRAMTVRLDVDDLSFADAVHALGMLTQTFYVPIDMHRVLVARDTRDLRQQYMRNALETVYLSGLSATEMTDMGNIAKNVFDVQQTAVDPTAGTLTMRAPEKNLNAFKTTYDDLMEGRSQVLIEVRLLQLAHNSTVNTGAQPPQTVTAFNVYAEEQSILNANQSLVQQIISSGLASAGDTATILGILLASGQVSSSLFSNGVALFGGGLTLSGVSPAPVTFNLNLNSSDSRELDDFQLRLQDGEEGTLKSGTRYPITTSSFSNLGASGINIPGLTSAGNSGSLSSLLSSVSGAATTIPQVEYQDLGLTMKATPRVLRSGDVALTVDLKITALAGSSVNGVPILANRAYSGVVIAPQDQAVVIASEMDRQQSRAISGFPGLSEIPGLNNATGKDIEKSDSTLLIIMTPHIVRSPHSSGHSPMLSVERSSQAR